MFLFGCIGGSEPIATATPSPTPTPTIEVIDALANAIASGVPYKCTVEVEGSTMELWIKGQDFRSITYVMGQKIESIKSGNNYYSMLPDGKWYKIDVSSSETPSDVKPTDIESLPKMGVVCNPDSFSNDLISPPAGAVDFDQYIKSITNASMPTSMPALDNETMDQLNDCSNYESIDCEMLPGELKEICQNCKG